MMYLVVLVFDLMVFILIVKLVFGVWCFLLLNWIKKGDVFLMFIWVKVLGFVDLLYNLLVWV